MHPEVRRLTVHHLNPHGSPRVRPLSAAGMPHPHWDLVLRRLRPAARGAGGPGIRGSRWLSHAERSSGPTTARRPGGTTMYVHARVQDGAAGGDTLRRGPATPPPGPAPPRRG